MKPIDEAIQVIPNLSMEIAAIYHKQSSELICLALNHNKYATEDSQKRATELLRVKDAKKIQEIVSGNLIKQINDYLNFATAAYQLVFDSQTQVTKILQQKMDDNCALTHEILKSQELAGNPISTIALTAMKSALDTSHAVMNGAKAAAGKTAELTKHNLPRS